MLLFFLVILGLYFQTDPRLKCYSTFIASLMWIINHSWNHCDTLYLLIHVTEPCRKRTGKGLIEEHAASLNMQIDVWAGQIFNLSFSGNERFHFLTEIYIKYSVEKGLWHSHLAGWKAELTYPFICSHQAQISPETSLGKALSAAYGPATSASETDWLTAAFLCELWVYLAALSLIGMQ